VAVVVDPVRDVGQYLDLATGESVELAWALETHVHNDFVSGARELVESAGTRLGASGDAGLRYPYERLGDGDEIEVGSWRLWVLATPGHTPEHVAYVLVDPAGKPQALFSGGALTWTMSVTAKIDLVGPINRGLAVGVDESAGYIGVGLGGFAAGLLVSSYGLRPAPYLLALGVVALGVLVTLGPARETLPFARSESAAQAGSAARTPARRHAPAPRLGRLPAYMSWHDRSMLAVCQAGFFNKFADSLVAAFFPRYLVRRGVSLAEVGLLVGVYAWVWGLGQVAAGALVDRIGRKAPITAGTLLIAGTLALFVATSAHGAWFAAGGLMGVGMALSYPNLITAVGDTADPAWRGVALGFYRLRRDGTYAFGPLVLGGIAVIDGITAAIWAGVALARSYVPVPRRQASSAGTMECSGLIM